ncbi:cysteine protease StiP family protein [Neobacillus sp. SM06]|uniref:cysteine protease StiP family protein n=1 Tax=Neobacillus sp. SM06 TaxID=3422492 RepID=UPI003D2BDF43
MIKSKQPAKIGSYKREDVVFLLKDLSSIQLEDSLEKREKKVQAGGHYSESLPIEYQPPKKYMDLFWQSLDQYKQKVALNIGIVAEQIVHQKGANTVLVSLARAGTPIGILMKRYIQFRFGFNIPHYSISIIRDRGIDENAIRYILSMHPNHRIQFVDGWTGKGAISLELTKACRTFEEKYAISLDDTLAVLADPGHCTTLFGTREDFLIPSACLNSTVSGLVSRTVLNKEYIGENDFHGAKYYRELAEMDVSNQYIDLISDEFPFISDQVKKTVGERLLEGLQADFIGMREVERLQKEFDLTNSHLIKPGVGETTRVLLRRVPWKVLIRDLESPYVKHVLLLAQEKKVKVEHQPNLGYLCCGLIKPMEGA